MRNTLLSIFGWYGTVAILVAYALVSFRLIQPAGYIYQLLNLTGSAGVIIISIQKRARQPAVLNLAWGLIAFIGIISLLTK